MQSKKIKNRSEVHILTKKADMKFIPEIYNKISEDPTSRIHNESMINSKLKQFFGFSNSRKSKLSTISNKSQIFHELQKNNLSSKSVRFINSSQIISKKSYIRSSVLKFAQKISTQHIIIGNQHQLDLIGLGNISEDNFIDTEYYWSLKFQGHISFVGVAAKKMNLLAIIVDNTLRVYKYDHKKISKQPFLLFKKITLQQIPFSTLMAKDGNICIFYKKKYEIFGVGETVRKKLNRNYQVPWNQSENNFEIIAVPELYQNILNIFFAEDIKSDNLFTLWCIELEFLALEVRSSEAQKIYDMKRSLKQSMIITNYSRDIYLLNLKSQILVMKRGYILDSANITMQRDKQSLNYMGNQILLLINNSMIEVYNFSLNTQVKPFRIQVTPKDSLKIEDNLFEYQFFKVLSLPNNDYTIIFQESPYLNRNKNGQARYCIFITRGKTKQQKVNLLFPKLNWKIEPQSADFAQKCQIAQKMGLTKKQIYLELWNRSKKCQKQDYQILISTDDYQTIQDEVLKKLRKSSMPFKEVQNIQKQCLNILRTRVFNAACKEQSVIQFISCHFFLRKLDMFRDIELIKREEKRLGNFENIEDKIIRITIRQYQNLRAMEVKTELIHLVQSFCLEGKQSYIRDIRLLLKIFKFVFRTIYYEILEEIIIKSGKKLKNLLKAIPELLPYTTFQQFKTGLSAGFPEGLWSEITGRQWKQALYLDELTTVDNKYVIVEKVVKGLWFRRNWLSQHDMITISRKEIEVNFRKIKSQETFYYFIAKMFEYLKDPQSQKSVITLLEQKYDIMPPDIKGRSFLMEKIYSFFSQRNLIPKINDEFCTLSQFLKFKDSQFLRHCFIEERSIKGLILKDIKPIFEQICPQKGKIIFNEAILNYFKSDLSEITDLKYILNRINNQKKQFHRNNQQMYKILVQALERKLMIGTEDDIPINQVLVYLENIPLWQNDNQTTKASLELKLIENINFEVEHFQKAKIHMSIYDILHNQDEVITKLVTYEVHANNVISEENFEITPQSCSRIQNSAYQIIASLQNISEDIYDKTNSFKIYFIYLTKLCEQAEMIKHVENLLQNESLKECYDETTSDSLVQYMYRWKMSEEKVMIKNQYYVSQLLNLIPKSSVTRIYLQSQMSYARILSRIQQPYLYPITQGVYTITDLQNQLRLMPIQFLMTLNLQKLHKIIYQMQKIYFDIRIEEDYLLGEQMSQQNQFLIINFVSLHQIYEIVIVQMLLANKLKEVLPYIRKILELDLNDCTYNVIYPLLYIIKICQEINDFNQHLLISCISYFFYDPWTLLQIIEKLTNQPLNTKQMQQFLQKQLNRGKKKSQGYNCQNLVFKTQYLQNLNTRTYQQNFMKIIQRTTKHMQELKFEFKDVKYAVIMAMLCNSPYALAKFISCSLQVNISAIRCFLSYAIREQVFESLHVLEVGKRIFFILLQSEKNKEAIEQVIQKYSLISFDQQIELEYIYNDEDKDSLKVWWKSALAFQKKKSVIKEQINNLNIFQRSKEEKSQLIIKSLQGKSEAQSRELCDYPFSEVDDDNSIQDIVQIRQSVNTKKDTLIFDASLQRSRVLEKNKKASLFHSAHYDLPKGGSGQFSMSIKIKGQGNNRSTSQEMSLNKIKSQEIQILRDSEMGNSLGVGDLNNMGYSNSLNLSERFERRSILEDQEQLQSEQYIDDQQLKDSYYVQIKQVHQQSSLEAEAEHSKLMNKSDIISQHHPQIIAESLIEKNISALETQKSKYDLLILEQYCDNKELLQQIVRKLYRRKPQTVKMFSLFKMIDEIRVEFPNLDFPQENLSMLMNIIQNQQKIIGDIPFQWIFSSENLFDNFTNKKTIFDLIKQNLLKYGDNQNIHQIGLFVRRAFNDPNLQGEITWDFIMNLCQKIENAQEEEVKMALQKIQVTLKKIKISIWISKFAKFAEIVLQSQYKDKLLHIFCENLSKTASKVDAQRFLTKLSTIDNSEIIQSTLKQVQKQIE